MKFSWYDSNNRLRKLIEDESERATQGWEDIVLDYDRAWMRIHFGREIVTFGRVPDRARIIDIEPGSRLIRNKECECIRAVKGKGFITKGCKKAYLEEMLYINIGNSLVEANGWNPDWLFRVGHEKYEEMREVHKDYKILLPSANSTVSAGVMRAA